MLSEKLFVNILVDCGSSLNNYCNSSNIIRRTTIKDDAWSCYSASFIRRNYSGDEMKKIWVHKAKSFKEADQWDEWFWKRAGAQARFAAAWRCIIDYYRMKGKNVRKPRLRRSVQNIERLSD